MKANEAPEKVILSTDSFEMELCDKWFMRDPTNNIKIEYIRKDAFIEKACKWLNDNVNNYWGTEFVDSGAMVEEFRKYMEGK